MSRQGPIVGIDLGGTNVQIGVVARDDRAAGARIVGRCRRKTKADEGLESVLARVAEGVDRACADAGLSRGGLRAVGIGAPGAVEPSSGVVLEAVNLRWDNVPLAGLLSERLGVPVVVDNDVNAAVWGEFVAGAGRGVTDVDRKSVV